MIRRLLWLLGFRAGTIERTLAYRRNAKLYVLPVDTREVERRVYGPRAEVTRGYGLAEDVEAKTR